MKLSRKNKRLAVYLPLAVAAVLAVLFFAYTYLQSTTIVPIDTSVIIEGVRNTSWGLGYSEFVEEGENLVRTEVRAHVRLNLTNHEYEVLYTLFGSADFLSVDVRNVSSTNKTTLVMTYRIGSSGSDSDTIRIGNVNETAFTS